MLSQEGPLRRRVERMRNRVKNMSTPARAAAPTAAPHVTFAPGVGGTPMPAGGVGGQSQSTSAAAAFHTPAATSRSSSSYATAQQQQQQHKTPVHSSTVPAAAAAAATGGGAAATSGKRRVSVDGLLTEYLRAQGNSPPHVRSERELRVVGTEDSLFILP